MGESSLCDIGGSGTVYILSNLDVRYYSEMRAEAHEGEQLDVLIHHLIEKRN
jgi:hypothetical protein